MTSLDGDQMEATLLDGDQMDTRPKQRERPVEILPTCSLLDKLFLYLSEDFEHFNITSAGYFSKVVMNLLRQNEQETLMYIFGHPSVVDGLILNMHFYSVAEVMASLLTIEEQLEGEHSDYYEQRWGIIERVFQIILSESHMDTLNNCDFILGEIFLKE